MQHIRLLPFTEVEYRLNSFHPHQSEDSKPPFPLGGNAVADSHHRGEKNTCGITTSHFTLSPCCPHVCHLERVISPFNKQWIGLTFNKRKQFDFSDKDNKADDKENL